MISGDLNAEANATAPSTTSNDSTDSPPPSANQESEEMHLVLRLRNDQRELHDIKFDFTKICEELTVLISVEGSLVCFLGCLR